MSNPKKKAVSKPATQPQTPPVEQAGLEHQIAKLKAENALQCKLMEEQAKLNALEATNNAYVQAAVLMDQMDTLQLQTLATYLSMEVENG